VATKKRGKGKVISRIAKTTQKGGLHRSLGIPLGQDIPDAKKQPRPGDSTKVKRQKALARTFARHRPRKGKGR
jgi:hypothetical protein